ncbi:MAG: hypothetical protein Ct9H90mP18_10920 [Gammaproteobacteria bacterium]|nr:MAG: hypothetical protein Ct9H90mP18_10920 [Gammaproteobacteria bacterium]
MQTHVCTVEINLVRGMLSRDHVIPFLGEVRTHGQMSLLLAKGVITQKAAELQKKLKMLLPVPFTHLEWNKYF